MRANSLALRLFFSAATWTVVILLVTGIVLSSLSRAAVERSFDGRLGVYLRALVADVASPDEGSDKLRESLGELLFELALYGWYWQVTRLDTPKPEVRSSRSLWDSSLPSLEALAVPANVGGTREGYVKGPEEQKLRQVERNVDLGEDGRFLVTVAGDAAEIEEGTYSFDRILIGTFAALAIVLLLITPFPVPFAPPPPNPISPGLPPTPPRAPSPLPHHF